MATREDQIAGLLAGEHSIGEAVSIAKLICRGGDDAATPAEAPMAFNKATGGLTAGGEPLNQLAATILPRTHTLANLKTQASGGGELASATDTPCIVQLNGAPGSGTAAVYSPMSPGAWVEDTSGSTISCTLGPPGMAAPGVTYPLTVQGAAVAPGAGKTLGGNLNLLGGNATQGTGKGGGVYLTGGQAAMDTGGGVTICGGGAATTGGGGPVTLSPGIGADPFTFAPAGGLLKLSNALDTVQLLFDDAGVSLVANEASVLKIKADGKMGFFAKAPAAKPTVTGSRGGNAALASLLTALANLGLITDSTSA